jgi:predicted secreted protein
MGIVSGLVVYFLTWWLVIFAVLPWGLNRDERGMPLNLNFKKKVLATTLISFVIWVFIYGVIRADIISFRVIADAMMEKDFGE